MTGLDARRVRFGLAAALFLALWATGLAQSTQSIWIDTYHDDIYAEIEQYRALREILDDALLAGFRTDSPDSRVTTARRWRFQYAAMPTILRPAFTDDSAIKMARGNARQDGSFHLVYEYRRPASLDVFDRNLREQAATAGCDVTSFDLAPRSVVYRLSGCSDD